MRGDHAEQPRQDDKADLAGAKVLIVDDDIRNIYSLTSVLETYDIEVLHAERGSDGIALLEQTPDVDVALIDIMMPEMDGYETMREIRKRPGDRRHPADFGDGQGNEGRPSEMPGRRRVRLHRQACRSRSSAGAAARVGCPLAGGQCQGRSNPS